MDKLRSQPVALDSDASISPEIEGIADDEACQEGELHIVSAPSDRAPVNAQAEGPLASAQACRLLFRRGKRRSLRWLLLPALVLFVFASAAFADPMTANAPQTSKLIKAKRICITMFLYEVCLRCTRINPTPMMIAPTGPLVGKTIEDGARFDHVEGSSDRCELDNIGTREFDVLQIQIARLPCRVGKIGQARVDRQNARVAK